MKAEIIAVTSANRIPYLQTKKADIVISSLGKNAEREKVIDFSVAYAPFFSGVFGTKDIKVAAPADLKGKTIGATRGAIEEQELSARRAARHHHQAVRGQQRHHRRLRLRPGRPDRDRQYGRRRHRREGAGPGADAEIRHQGQPCYIGLNKDEPKLLAKINEIIAQAKTSGEIAKLSEKWLKAPLPPGF